MRRQSHGKYTAFRLGMKKLILFKVLCFLALSSATWEVVLEESALEGQEEN